MKYTNLEMVQEILSDMDSDEITAISDTTEAGQVVRCIRQSYYALIEDLDPPQHYVTFTLTAGGSSAPTILLIPDTISKMMWVKYNKISLTDTSNNYEEVRFMPKHEFFDRMYLLDGSETNVGSFNYQSTGMNMPLFYRNDRAPTYYTSFDNAGTVIFDSIDTSVDSFLTADKNIAYGRKTITYDLDDDFVPDLEEPMFSRLLNEAKILAFAELKSVDHAIANRNAQRSRNRSPENKFRTRHMSDFDQLPNFARRR